MLQYSFIIPVYKCEKYLNACVQSILGQDIKKEFEIILVDDGSPDNSGELADKLAQEYSNIRTFHKENGGAASARNRGISEAEGKYLLFIDGDDTIASGLMESVEQYLEKDAGDLIIYGMSFDYYRKGVIEQTEKICCGHNGRYGVEDVFRSYPAFFYDNALSSACNKVFLAETVKKNHILFNEAMTLYEDYDFVLRYLMHTDYVRCIAEPYYHYRHDVEDIHLDHRVRDFDKLRRNMNHLLQTSLKAGRGKGREEVPFLEVTADLYMQLLIRHLMNHTYSVKELGERLRVYCGEPDFRRILEDPVNLRKEYRKLLAWTDAGRFRTIQIHFMKKRTVSKIKKRIKKVFRS